MKNTGTCSSSPWCDEDKCKCAEYYLLEKIAGYKYEVYCANCGGIVAYTNKKLGVEDVMIAKDFILPSGYNPTHGDIIKCYCKISLITNLRQRENYDFDERYLIEQDSKDKQNGII